MHKVAFVKRKIRNLMQISNPLWRNWLQLGIITDMNALGEKIKTLRLARGWSQKELASHAGIAQRSVASAETVADQVPRDTTLAKIAHALKVSIEYLKTEGKSSLLEGGKGIPIINTVQEGAPIDYEDVGEMMYDYCPILPAYVNDPDAFAALVVGDAMDPDWRENEVAIFSPRLTAQNGMFCFVKTIENDQTQSTFRRVFIKGDEIELRPLNPRHSSRFVHRSAIRQMSPVVGKWTSFRYANARAELTASFNVKHESKVMKL